MNDVFVMYKLRPDVKVEDFMHFSREIDKPLVLKQDCVHSFDVFEIQGARSGAPAFDIVEHLTVASWQEFVDLSQIDELKKNGEEFRKYADPDTIRVMYGARK